MSKQILSTEEQIKKLNTLQKMANEAVNSERLIERLGAIIIFTGIADFYAIQAARLLEQALLKSELAQNKTPSFQPKEDSYFYDKRVSTRSIVKKIEKFLPFKIHDKPKENNEEKINIVVREYLKSTEKFLNYRNTLLHHIGSPKVSEGKIFGLIQKCAESFSEMTNSQQEFFETWKPYRFGYDELKYFYSKK